MASLFSSSHDFYFELPNIQLIIIIAKSNDLISYGDRDFSLCTSKLWNSFSGSRFCSNISYWKSVSRKANLFKFKFFYLD